MQEGDSIVSLGGVYGTVENVIIVDTVQTMYDLTVEEVHTFAVGDGDWVVHNDECYDGWAITPDYNPRDNARYHWRKHQLEFANEYDNAAEYAQGAVNFVENPPAGSIIRDNLENGRTAIYHRETNTLAFTDSFGKVRSMFRPNANDHNYPTNLEYVNSLE